MAIITLKQAGPIATWQDPFDPGWYPEVTIVGDPNTAWRDDSDATYAIANTTSQQQLQQQNLRPSSPTAPMELAPSIADFTVVTAHMRLRTETNKTDAQIDVGTGTAHQFAIEWWASPDDNEDYRFGLASSSSIEQYDFELWPGFFDEESQAYFKPYYLNRLNNGHALNFWSVAGGFQAPTDWWSRTYVYEVWITVDGVPEPEITGRPDPVRRRFT